MQIDLPATPEPGAGGFVDCIDDLLTGEHMDLSRLLLFTTSAWANAQIQPHWG
jgi:hypothetical protein